MRFGTCCCGLELYHWALEQGVESSGGTRAKRLGRSCRAFPEASERQAFPSQL